MIINNNVLIRGIRYKCLHCPDYDFCETCETKNQSENFHANNGHVFAKIYKPTVLLFSLECLLFITAVANGLVMEESLKELNLLKKL